MDKRRKRFIYIIKFILAFLLFYWAVYFENAVGNRLYVLIFLFIIYLSIGIIKALKSSSQKMNYVFVIVDLLTIFLMEYNSRFLINYFFHSFYIIELLDISILFDQKNSLITGCAATVVSSIKFFFLLYYKFNINNISQTVFFILVTIFVLVITNFAQYYREEKKRKDQLYNELLNAHKELKEYSKKIQELTIIKERNRLARELHDNIGHNMTALIMEMELMGRLLDKDPEKVKLILQESKQTAREGLAKLREVVRTLKPNDMKTKTIDSIKDLVNKFSTRTGIKTLLKIEGDIIDADVSVSAVLYAIIQESLTNSVKHGKATKVEINIKYNGDKLNFLITDNGVGSEQISEGFGLRNMRERVEGLKGSISFTANKGFTVKGYLPLEGK